jgi:hypothetical protein
MQVHYSNTKSSKKLKIGNIEAKCPRADQIQIEIRASPAFQNVSRENAAFFGHISEMAGSWWHGRGPIPLNQ